MIVLTQTQSCLWFVLGHVTILPLFVVGGLKDGGDGLVWPGCEHPGQAPP